MPPRQRCLLKSFPFYLYIWPILNRFTAKSKQAPAIEYQSPFFLPSSSRRPPGHSGPARCFVVFCLFTLGFCCFFCLFLFFLLGPAFYHPSRSRRRKSFHPPLDKEQHFPPPPPLSSEGCSFINICQTVARRNASFK